MSYLTLNKTMNYPAMDNGNGTWSPVYDIRHEMGKLFDDFRSASGVTRNLQEMEPHWIPACDVLEADDHYLIALEIAGVSKDQVKVEFHDNQIVISGERQNETKKKKGGQRYSERRFGKFQRAFTLPSGSNPDQVQANHQDGVLRVYIPKAESAKPRQIKISNGVSANSFRRLMGQTPPEEEEEKGGTTFT